MTTSESANRVDRLNFFPLEPIRLHGVPRLERIEALEADTALLSRGHLPDVLFEVLQRANPALEHHLPSPEQLHPASTADLALRDATPRDHAHARDLDGSDHLHLTLSDLPVGGLAQALGRALDVLCELVDHVVVADLDLRPLGSRLRGRRRLEVEAHDDGVGDA